MTPDQQRRRRAQQRKRFSFMPWLYFNAKAPHEAWITAWQARVQRRLSELETVVLGEGCFIADTAAIFAEPNRTVTLGDRCAVAAHAFLHGPITLGDDVSINAHACLDGGRLGIVVGSGSRIAARVTIYAFDHGLSPGQRIMDQPTTSRGVHLGKDVWVGAGAGITDGVKIGDHAVIGMGSVVTREVADYAIVAGSPARVVGDRRER